MENKNKPAYPVSNNNYSSVGLTKREYFAGLAMQGIMANGTTTQGYRSIVEYVRQSIEVADELLNQLNP